MIPGEASITLPILSVLKSDLQADPRRGQDAWVCGQAAAKSLKKDRQQEKGTGHVVPCQPTVLLFEPQVLKANSGAVVQFRVAFHGKTQE